MAKSLVLFVFVTLVSFSANAVGWRFYSVFHTAEGRVVLGILFSIPLSGSEIYFKIKKSSLCKDYKKNDYISFPSFVKDINFTDRTYYFDVFPDMFCKKISNLEYIDYIFTYKDHSGKKITIGPRRNSYQLLSSGLSDPEKDPLDIFYEKHSYQIWLRNYDLKKDESIYEINVLNESKNRTFRYMLKKQRSALINIKKDPGDIRIEIKKGSILIYSDLVNGNGIVE
ncbi:hypothetical protein [Gallaecimonas sp. GXIMD1310]|uniref:hypothetical protein n=1 Tax=Gallaecimonas sp. GXIMD1310 TaxID=3131926 RepID=UPI003252459D